MGAYGNCRLGSQAQWACWQPATVRSTMAQTSSRSAAMRLEGSPWLGFSQLLSETSCGVSSELFVREKLNPHWGVWAAHNLWVSVGFREFIPHSECRGRPHETLSPRVPFGSPDSEIVFHNAPRQPEEGFDFLECFAGAWTGVSQIPRMP